jgi:hypothetical protein
MQELTQICLPMAASLDARSTDVQYVQLAHLLAARDDSI